MDLSIGYTSMQGTSLVVAAVYQQIRLRNREAGYGLLGFSDCLPCAKSRGPRPLKIEPAKMPRYIHHFADEVHPRDLLALHGFRRELVRVHATDGDLRLVVT